jgi:hypothetical protein
MQRALHHSGPHCQTKALKDTSGLATAHTCAGGGVANVGGGAAGGLLGTLCHCRQAGRGVHGGRQAGLFKRHLSRHRGAAFWQGASTCQPGKTL